MTENAPRLPSPTLMLVTDRRLTGGEEALIQAVSEAVEGGVNVVQLREKDLAPAALLPLARRLREVTAGRALLIVNGPVDVALEAGADGVHLPEGAPMVARPRGPFLIGRSVHSAGAAERAEGEGADYVVAGPVYETASHPGAPGLDPEGLRAIVQATRLPVIAIGGITAENAAAAIGAGAWGVAAISVFFGGPPRRAAESLWMAITGARRAASGRTSP